MGTLDARCVNNATGILQGGFNRFLFYLTTSSEHSLIQTRKRDFQVKEQRDVRMADEHRI